MNKILTSVGLFCVAFLLSLLVYLSSAIAQIRETPEELKTRADYITAAMEQYLLIDKGEGTDAMIRFWGAHTKSGYSLTSLGKYILDTNGGKPIQLKVPVNPESKANIEFANSMLDVAGITYYRYVAELDPRVPKVEVALLKDKASVESWNKVRVITVPNIAFAAGFMEAGLLYGTGTHHGYVSLLFATAAQGFMTRALERQFSRFSGLWAKFFRTYEPKGSVDETLVLEDQAHDTKLLTKIQSNLMKVVEFLSRQNSYVKSAEVNWAYQVFLALSGVSAIATAKLIGLEIPPHYFNSGHLAQEVGAWFFETLIVTTPFYVAFAIPQVIMSRMEQRGQISELARFQTESTSAIWNSFWRAEANLPNAGLPAWISPKILARKMQLGFGFAMTPFMIAKGYGATAYAKSIRAQALDNDGEEPLRLSLREKALASVFEKMPLNRQWTLQQHLTQIFPRTYPKAESAALKLAEAARPAIQKTHSTLLTCRHYLSGGESGWK